MPINNLNTLSREEYLRKRRKKKYIRYGILLLAFFILIGVLSYGAHRKEVRIKDVKLSGGLLVTEKDVKEEALKYLNGSYFWLFPKDNSFFYPKSKLEKHLYDTFKRIETIEIKLDDLNIMQVNITERKPIAIWCSDVKHNVLATTSEGVISMPSEKCYFIDLFSTIFADAPNFSGDAYFKYYGLVEKENPIGEKFMASSTEFTAINSFIELSKTLGIKPLYLKSKGEGEFSLVLFGDGEIFFDIKKPLETSYRNLETLLKTPELAPKQGYLPVEYIDLRYGNKLFYKLKTN